MTTVAELIDKLLRMPPGNIVVLPDERMGGWIGFIEKIEVEERSICDGGVTWQCTVIS